MNRKHLSILSILVLSACGGGGTANVPNDGGDPPIIPIPPIITNLTFNSPINNQAYILNSDILIDLSTVTEQGKVEINIGGELITLDKPPYTYLWQSRVVGTQEIRAKFFATTGELISEGKIDIVVVSANEEMINIVTNVGKIVDVKIGEILTLTATSQSQTPLSKVEFVFNDVVVKEFSQEPYTMDWQPTEFDKKEFSIRAISSDPLTPVVTIPTSTIRSFSQEAISYCDEHSVAWQETGHYLSGDYVKHNNHYFIPRTATSLEPTLVSSAVNPWSNISCDNMVLLTKPFVSAAPPGGRFNENDEIRIGVNIRPLESPQVKIASVTAHRNGEMIKMLTNDLDQTYIHTVKLNAEVFPKDSFKISVRNSFNLEHTIDVTVHGNTPPTNKFEIRQTGYVSGDYAANKPIVLFSTVRDIENKVRYVEFFINGVSQGRYSKPGRPFQDVFISLEVELAAGNHLIQAKAVDDDGGVTEVTKSIVVK